MNLYTYFETPPSLKGFDELEQFVPSEIILNLSKRKKISKHQEVTLFKNIEDVAKILNKIESLRDIDIEMPDDFINRAKERIWEGFKNRPQSIYTECRLSLSFIVENNSVDTLIEHADELFLPCAADAIFFLRASYDSLPSKFFPWKKLHERIIETVSHGSIEWKPWAIYGAYFKNYLNERFEEIEPFLIKHYEHWILDRQSNNTRYIPYYVSDAKADLDTFWKPSLIWMEYAERFGISIEPEESVLRRLKPELFS